MSDLITGEIIGAVAANIGWSISYWFTISRYAKRSDQRNTAAIRGEDEK